MVTKRFKLYLTVLFSWCDRMRGVLHGSFARSFYSVSFAKLAIAKLFYVITSTFSPILYVEPKNNSYRLEPRIVLSIHQKPRVDVDHGVQRITPLPLILGLRNASAAVYFPYRPLCLRNYLRLAQNNSAHHSSAPNRLGFRQSLHPPLLGLPFTQFPWTRPFGH